MGLVPLVIESFDLYEGGPLKQTSSPPRREMTTNTSEKYPKPSKPDLDSLYKPLGIQAVAAANCCCSKAKDKYPTKPDADYPCATD
ncbi:hypothetical protein E1162_15995 [Rhodobacteraceae bacterium RKSG542]|uniref:hypothetical protein n=1 Tax=Pseudovibrio flavus TaxID=2529854 RepID=UPI0012BC9098|nr:hypothetical protein [Pseudovibrio flavus]MTI18748.1 hypothetical protein [Pseudovibrio flavus]